MNFRKILTASLLAASIALPSAAQQPYSGCWFLNEVLDWTPDSDPDAKFNRSRVPMAERFTEPELMKYHPDQTYVGTVETATITTKMCSLCPSQGDNHFLVINRRIGSIWKSSSTGVALPMKVCLYCPRHIQLMPHISMA